MIDDIGLIYNNTNTTTNNNNNNENNNTLIVAMCTITTKHNEPSVVVVAKDREEVLSLSIGNNNKKRKIRNEDDVNNDDDIGDNVHCDGIMTQRQSQISRCWCTFHDFRFSTIQEHPSFLWLGPSSMAVYWYKEYLQTIKQGWIRIPKDEQKKYSSTIIPPSSHLTAKGTTRTQQHKLERKPQQIQKQKQKQNSKGNFYFIPGQYL